MESGPQYTLISPARCEASLTSVGIKIVIFLFQYKLEHLAKLLKIVYCLQPYSVCRGTMSPLNCSAVTFCIATAPFVNNFEPN